MKKLLIGVDPGWNGAIAFWPIGMDSYPRISRCPADILGIRKALNEIFALFAEKIDSKEVWKYEAAIEAIWFFPQGGRNSAIAAENRMAWEMLFTCYDIPYRLVLPKAWQKLVQRERGSDVKQKAWRYARKRFPELGEQLGEKPPTKTRGNSGLSDSLCILAWLVENS